MSVRRDGYTYCHVTRDFATRVEAMREAARYRRRDSGWAVTRVVRVPGGEWTVVQRIKRGAAAE